MRIKKLILLFILLSSSIGMYAQPSSEKLIKQGVKMHDKGRYGDAINLYQQALRINPTSMSATYEMSLSYLKLNDYENALRYSTKVINANYQSLLVDAYCVKSSALAGLNKYDLSIKSLIEALDRCGDEYLLHFNLGLSYFKVKDLKLALLHLRKAIEIDTTHPGAFLLYAYALGDADKWVQSFAAFHFFLLLEPNTERSKDAFGEMYDILSQKLPMNDARLNPEDGINRKDLYNQLQKIKPASNDLNLQYKYYEQATKTIFFVLTQMQNDSQQGLLWDFFVPIYTEILESGYFETYCRYVSVSYFPSSLEWWQNNTVDVDKFIGWFEEGQGEGANDEAEYGDDSEDAS